MTEAAHPHPRAHWLHDHLDVLRRVALFVVGAFIVVDATVLHDGTNVLELVLGLLVLGVVPAEVVTTALGR